MLSFLSHRKPDHSDSESEQDDINDHQPKPMTYALSFPMRYDALSTDTLDDADGPVSHMIANNLRPDEEKGLTENGGKNGISPSVTRSSKIPKAGGRIVTASDKQKADNIYAANKSVAESMMDIALLTSNANQLKFLLSYNTKSKTFYVNVALIAISLILQVAVGVSLIVKKNMKGRRYSRASHFLNQFVVVAIFLVTVINVFVAAFTTADTS